MPLIFRNAQLTRLSHLPVFRFEEEPRAAVASRASLVLLGLAIPAVLLGVVAWRSLRRYPVIG